MTTLNSGSAATTITRTEPGAARDRAFLAASALLFIASAAGTVYWCLSMSGGMAMPGGWTMSMAWMRMPDQSWLGAAAGFIAMWMVMMVAMMLPSLVPALAVYRRALRGRAEPRLSGLTVLAGAGYFFVWVLLGAVVYPCGVVWTKAEMQWSALARFAPIATGVVLLLAGSLQLTTWKARQLCLCRDTLLADVRSPWPQGVRLGVHCVLCCSGFMTILLVSGVMDLVAMAVVTAAITVERLASRPQRAARVAGLLTLAAGAFVIGRAIGV
jgi:predicted metal-binding membrane protein